MVRVLVTGASGFVGRHLASLLVASREYEVWGTGKTVLPPGSAIASKQFLTADLVGGLDPQFIAIAAPDVVVHLAGAASVGRSWRYVEESLDSSVVGAVALHSAMRDAGVKLRRWIDIGSSEEYFPSELPLTEESLTLPTNPYGFGKLAQARTLQYLCSRDNIEFVHFRPFNHIGPGQSLGFVIPDWADQIIRLLREHNACGRIRVGNIDVERDFVDVRDVVRAYTAAIDGKVPPGTYNVSSGVPRSLRAVFEEMTVIAGVTASVESDQELDRPSDARIRIGDSSKLASACSWRPKIAWHDSLRDVLGYFAQIGG